MTREVFPKRSLAGAQSPPTGRQARSFLHFVFKAAKREYGLSRIFDVEMGTKSFISDRQMLFQNFKCGGGHG